MKLDEVLQEARDLITNGICKSQIQKTMSVYIDKGELSHPYEAPACLYLASYEIEDCSEEEAEAAYEAYSQYGNGIRDNTFEDTVAIGKEYLKGLK